jgi:carboxylesterase type B
MYKGSGGNATALNFGSQCAQGNSGSEDCLFLNIWTPHLPRSKCSKKALKPVMFWIHGGAFTGGTGSDPTFDGGNIAARGDVVMVAVNYRLSTLGFLALKDGVTNGNFGLADQILALDWVRANIQDFGGDPDRITIFGQSAGAGSVRAMMASPKALGKFAGAIPLSNLGGLAYGTTYSRYYTIDEEVNVAANAILTATNCTSAVSQLDCLRALPATTLTSLPTIARYIVVDGTYITSNQLQLKGPRLPFNLMMGITAEDGAPFISYTRDVSAQNTNWLTSQGLPYPPRDVYPLQNVTNQTLAVDRMGAREATDAIFRCVDQATVYAGLQSGVLGDKVFYYEFDRSYQTAGWPNLDLCEPPKTADYPNGDPESEPGYLKCHSGELLYVFGNLARMGRPLRDDLDLPFQQYILDLFSSFARTFDPNPDTGYLKARGYESTLGILEITGPWKPSVKGEMKMRVLDWPRAKSLDWPGSADGDMMTGFRDLEQCAWLNLPITYYM